MTQEEFFKRYTYDVDVDRIGGGGFGTVYKAYDNVLHHDVAIKVSEVKKAPNGKTFSLRDEIEALSALPEHPNIANYEKEKLFTFKMPNGHFDYAVMQYYPDGNLTQAIKEGLTDEQKEEIAEQLLEGIGFLHRHKVVHRDLKPGNILVAKHGGKVIPLITDFGLSKAANAGDGSVFTNSFGGGTQRYSSPEQLQGQPLRFNTDLWSYGAIVYELFTGEALFSPGSGASNTAQADLEIYNKIIHGDVQNLGKMPERWRKVAERCLVVDPGKRAKNAEELMGILKDDEEETEVNTGLGASAQGSQTGEETILNGSAGGSKRPAPRKEEVPQPTNPVPTSSAEEPSQDGKSKKGLWIGMAAVAAVVVLAVLLLKPKKETVTLDTQASSLTIPVNGVSFVMKKVEGGTFTMGVEQGSYPYGDEKPAHGVTVSTFYMGETEVTQALWKAVMGSNPSHWKGDNLPVENVSWNDCQEFIRKLNQMTGRNFRLPTEAEWEFAARGGKRSKGTRYAGGNSIGNVAWYDGNSGNKTHAVKGKSPNELGLYDMSGNVWEWCSDWYGDHYYSNSPSSNPKGPSSGSLRVLRGGSWYYIARYCRVSIRFSSDPGLRHNRYGFRLVLPQ